MLNMWFKCKERYFTQLSFIFRLKISSVIFIKFNCMPQISSKIKINVIVLLYNFIHI